MNNDQNRDHNVNIRALMRLALILSAAFVMVLMMSAAVFAEYGTIQYIDENGNSKIYRGEYVALGGRSVNPLGRAGETTWVYLYNNVRYENGQRLEIRGNVNLVLSNYAKLEAMNGIRVADNCTLRVYATTKNSDNMGEIIADASGADAASGIGSNPSGDAGTCSVYIYGGKVTAKGGRYGAGIGGSDENGFKEIAIYGGEVNATGGEYGAGIGTGDKASGKDGLIYIYGGNVKAYGGSNAAGIGGSRWNGCNVQIVGGTVEAHGGKYGAGIGGGDEGDCDVMIRDADVSAYGGEYGAGIGSGDKESCGSVTIDGSTDNTKTIRAFGGYNAAGIGGGSTGDGGMITIRNGKVEAQGGKFGAGIGGGYEGDAGYIRIMGGDVTARSGLAEPVASLLRSSTGGAGIGGGSKGNAGDITISGGTVNARGGARGAGIGTGGECEVATDDIDDKAGSIHISGGNVTADSREYGMDTTIEHSDGGAGIGSGAKSYVVDIEITGGDITAYASFYTYSSNKEPPIYDNFKNPSAAVGEGYDPKSKGGKLLIKETSIDDPQLRITAVKVPYQYMPAFRGKLTLDYTSGRLVLVDYYGKNSKAAVKYRTDWMLNGSNNYETNKAAQIVLEPCTGHSSYQYSYDDNTHSLNCPYCEFSVDHQPHDFTYKYHDSNHWRICTTCGWEEKTLTQHSFDANGNCICGYEGVKVTLKDGKDVGSSKTIWRYNGQYYELPEYETTGFTPPGNTEFLGWKIGDKDDLRAPGQNISIYEDTVITAVYGTNWAKFKDTVQKLVSGNTVVLAYDVVAMPTDEHIIIEGQKNVTIDLNGHTIDRRGGKADKSVPETARDIFLIKGNGSLTIKDSKGSGSIKGGKITTSNDAGGAVTIEQGGTFTLEGGSITDNTALHGCGVLIKGGIFNMTGGKITGNLANIGAVKGTAVYVESGSFKMTGGEITNNGCMSADPAVAAVQTKDNSGTINIGGPVQIHDNYVITGFDFKSADRDVYLNSGQKISITGNLNNGTNTALIGVSTADEPTETRSVPITTQLSGRGNASNFISNAGKVVVIASEDGNAHITLDNVQPIASRYKVILKSDGLVGGVIAADKNSGIEGTEVRLTAIASDGYSWKTWQAYKNGDQKNNEGFVDPKNANAIYTIKGYDVTIEGIFEPIRVKKIIIKRVTGEDSIPVSIVNLDQGQTAQLTTETEPAEALNKKVTWSSKDERVATVDQDGKVTAVGRGTAIIMATATDGSKINNICTVNVEGVYTVNFDTDGGIPEVAGQKLRWGSQIDTSGIQSVTKSGYELLGWKEELEGGKIADIYYDFDHNYVYSDMTLKAVWLHTDHNYADITNPEKFDHTAPHPPESCEVSGNIEYWKCRECNRYFKEGKTESGDNTLVEIAEGDWVIPKGSHIWGSIQYNESGHFIACTRCGTKSLDEKHKMNIKSVVSPTYDAPGSVTYECETCHYNREITVPPLVRNEYSITPTITGEGTGSGNTVELSAYKGKEGDKINIQAIAGGAGYGFKEWYVNENSGAKIDDPTRRSAILTVGTGDIVLRAHFGYVVTKVSLNKGTLELEKGATDTLKATVYGHDHVDKSIVWSSSDESVATVDQNGKVTALKAGTAIIRAKAKDGSNKSATCIVTVKEDEPSPSPSPSGSVSVRSVTLDLSELALQPGAYKTLIATIDPENATNKRLIWSSSDESVATVDENGGITAIKAGTAIISVRTADGGKTASCVVTVSDDAEPVIATTNAARAVAKGSKSIKLTWTKVKGADRYVIYMAKGSGKYKKIATVKGSKKSYTKKNLKKNTKYRFKIVAQKLIDGEYVRIGAAKVMSAVTANRSGKFTNAKKVTVKPKSVSLKVGKTKKIKAKITKAKAGKKLISKKLRYFSTDNGVAKVSSKGKIRAVAPGRCSIYVQAHNGVWAVVKVTVK